MSSLQAQEQVDWAVIGCAGATAVLALAACAYTVPWRRRAAKDPTRGSFSLLWRGRVALSLLSAAWAVSQLLRVSILWGANSVVLPQSITSWTGAGWMIYLTVSLGLLQPLCAFTALLMLTAALSRRHRPEAARHPNARLLGLAALCTLPVAAVQSVIAWLGVAVQYQGRPIEASPRSVLGIFFATYWAGSPQQCGTSDTDVGLPAGAPAGAQPVMLASTEAPGSGGAAPEEPEELGGGGCTACVFPAAAVIAQGLFTLAFLAALWVTSARLVAAVLNTRLKRRVRLFQAAYSLLAVAGVAALGVSLVRGPFSWLNIGCWAGYVATVALTVALVLWEVAVWPVRELRAVDKRLALWADATTAAALAAAADEALGSQLGGGPGGLIKAHNRSSDAEAYVAAAATARTLSASRQAETAPTAPRLAPTLPPVPPPLSPQRQATLKRQLSPKRPPPRHPSLLWQQQQQQQQQQHAPPASPYRPPPMLLAFPTQLASPSRQASVGQQLYPASPAMVPPGQQQLYP
ncbi:hypothetical protein CHLNCDRAFT_140060 [Chlorella variabilis]|uniref:Uncharacterized protein n=1 Tax=Chlorella variabilis TaxID=554065 RepID=E1ZRH8_CHLVA|nr:hypothetical protein CHLNCDRAFT_140060 [Chlorella variabilis]EFN51571.1 hypothetical protein CHLNCDRAFT_140060 [Chlorella variabilis]|eukprot:XP_005843673.1 hypothetical protein CHLNCDRAFT_140060 [Chlorella variabilis]